MNMTGAQLKYRRDHASPEEKRRYQYEKAAEIYNKLYDIFVISVNEQVTPVNGKYISHNSAKYKDLQKTIDMCREKMNYLNNKYLAPCQNQ